MKKHILVIDDEKDLIELLKYNLEKNGYMVDSATNGNEGFKKAEKILPNLIILDLMLPGMDGLEVCKSIRENPKTSALPIIMLTAKAEETDKVLGLEFGADDYITKPFSIREVLARIKAVLRRNNKEKSIHSLTKFKILTLDNSKREAKIKNRNLILTTTEFNLLWHLMNNPGVVVSREKLINASRGEDVIVTDRTIDVHMVSLRKKLGKFASYVKTIRGIGYKLEE